MLDCRQKSAARSTIKYNFGNPPETYVVAWCDDEYSAVFERVYALSRTQQRAAYYSQLKKLVNDFRDYPTNCEYYAPSPYKWLPTVLVNSVLE